MAQLITMDNLSPILSRIDNMCLVEKVITPGDAEDLSDCVVELVNKPLNESNISAVVGCLRNAKEHVNKDAVSRIIKLLITILG